MKPYLYKLFIVMVAATVLVVTTSGVGCVLADKPPEAEVSTGVDDIVAKQNLSAVPAYSTYVTEGVQTAYAGGDIVISGDAYLPDDSTAVSGVREIDGRSAVMTGETGYTVWEVEVPADGRYRLSVTYYPLEGYGSDIERHLLIDDSIPCQEARYMVFHRVWADAVGTEAFVRDSRGNEIRPEQVEAPRWVSRYAKDATGYTDEELTFSLTAGRHRLTLESVKEPMAIAELRLTAPAIAVSYADYAARYAGMPTCTGQYIEIPAEHAAEKTDSSLFAVTDRTSPMTDPQDPSKIRLNTIGGTKWQSLGQTLTWRFHVERDGWYRIAMRCKKDQVSGMFSSRRVYIDGEMPFDGVSKVRFNYAGSWRIEELGNDDGAYLFYLQDGDHTIGMEVVLGDMAAILGKTEDCLVKLNTIYREILMITGSTPDRYRNYKFGKVIPDTLVQMKATKEELETIVEELVAITGKRGEGTGLIDQMIFQLEQMLDNPEERIAANFSMFKSNISSLGSWIVSAKNQPLQLDYLAICTEDMPLKAVDSNFFVKIGFEMRSFIASFFNDYDMVGDQSTGKESVLVWVSTGRDQASVLKQLVDEEFSDDSVSATIQLVAGGSLLPSTLAGVGPDVSLENAGNLPVDYGLRGAVLDVSGMDGFDEVYSRFHESAWVPYTFNGHIYGVPQTQNISLLFYRSDILEDLELKVPETWEEFYSLIPVIKNNNMDIGFPSGGLAGTLTFLYQNGGELYRDNGARTNLDSDMALAAFQKTCELFTKQTLPVSYDFANRFKTGEMPLGIADYTFYNQLAVFAPEIKGMWSFALIPGTVRSNERGESYLDHSIGTGGSSVVIMSNCRNRDGAWKFVKWFTDTEAQCRYAREVESILGPSGKYATANREAFKRISTWTAAESEIIQKQWEWTVGTPEVPGGYYTSRCVEFAYSKTYNEGENPVESMLLYIDEINQELTRKREEFHVE